MWKYFLFVVKYNFCISKLALIKWEIKAFYSIYSPFY